MYKEFRISITFKKCAGQEEYLRIILHRKLKRAAGGIRGQTSPATAFCPEGATPKNGQTPRGDAAPGNPPH
jgi:hypothetical protein